MKTLYVSDLDGTLLNEKQQISDYSKRIINKLIREGLLFTFATARSYSSARIVTEGLLTQTPVILYNGACILDTTTQKMISSVSFTREECDKVRDVLKKYKIVPLVYAYVEGKERVSWLAGKENEGVLHYLASRKKDKRLRPLIEEERLYEGNPFYFTCIGEREELLPIYEELKLDEHYTCLLQPEIYRKEYWCEIMPKKATKANAILQLKEYLGCEKIVSFGDAQNDIPMFQISDECYAVENAVLELKKIATGIILNSREDGVAKCLLERILSYGE